MKKLVVRGPYLAWEDGTPFFYLADTAWEAAHRLSRDEMLLYLDVRARQGFNAMQVVALAELDGLTLSNAHGRLPLLTKDGLPDPTQPDLEGPYSYWDHLDFLAEEAGKRGIFLTLLPTWGDKFNPCWGKGPVIFTPESAERYGAWIGARYKNRWNIIWMLGGDRALQEPVHRAVIDAMARGIRSVDTDHLITFHPTGNTSSVDFVGDAPYMDIHSAQTGHSVECYTSDSMMERMRPFGKPFFDSEPRYEDHPACFNDKLGYFWQAGDVRINAYWDVLAGTCGHTYGNHAIWSMNREKSSYFPFTWQEALEHPGAEQIGFVKRLRLSRDYFSLRPAPELLRQDWPGTGHMAAARGKDYAFAYAPQGLPFTVGYDFAPAKQVKASWFNPRTGEEALFGVLPSVYNTVFVPPQAGTDWVLILDAPL